MSTLGYLGVATLVLLLSVAAPAFAVVTSRVLRSDALTCNVIGPVAPAFDVLASDGLVAHTVARDGRTSDARVATGSTIAGLNGVAIEGVASAPGTRG